LLDGARAPRPGLDRGVVGHDRDRAAVDAADAGDHAVGGEVRRLAVGQERVLDERRAVVAQARQALAAEQLPFLGVLSVGLLRAAGARLGRARRELGRSVVVGHGVYLPWYLGGRFSTNARIPSARSSVSMVVS